MRVCDDGNDLTTVGILEFMGYRLFKRHLFAIFATPVPRGHSSKYEKRQDSDSDGDSNGY